MHRIHWGALSTAATGIEEVVPAMQKGRDCEVVVISSRRLDKARATATRLRIPRAFGSYEELLADPDTDALYNPLPNHLHVSWSLEALRVGKHLLCEKPLALTADGAQRLLDGATAHPHLKVMEGFMYRHHPQWQRAREIVADGGIGDLKTVQSFFSFRNVDRGNIRNIVEFGGGVLLDIGCHCISASRFTFAPSQGGCWASQSLTRASKTDRFISGTLISAPVPRLSPAEPSWRSISRSVFWDPRDASRARALSAWSPMSGAEYGMSTELGLTKSCLIPPITTVSSVTYFPSR